MSDYSALFTPYRINTLELPNRIAACAIGGTSLIENGSFNSSPLEFFMNLAKNDVGLIIPGLALLTDKWGREGWLDESRDVFLGPVKEFLKKIHGESSSKLILQISAGMGRGLRAPFGITLPYFNYQRAMVGPSENLPNAFAPEMKHRALTKKEIQKYVEVMINSTALAQEAGCDGVELHAIHEGYLLDQFAISNYNYRTDEYGGSLENRLRISTDMIKGIRKKCGKDFPILMRYSVVSKTKGFNNGALFGEEFKEWGRDADESIRVIRILEDAGVDAIDADNGTFDSWHWCHPPTYMPDACNLPEAAFIKQHCNIPVIVSGKMGDPDIALSAVKEGLADAIGLARPFLADEEWAKKVKENHTGNIRPCIGCHNGCFGRLTSGKNVSCALNPHVLQENTFKIVPVEKPGKMIIAGAGIAGLEAARTAALRGFNVKIIEKSHLTGGMFNAACALSFKEADKKLLKWYQKQISDLNIKIEFNTTIDDSLLQKEKPDILIIATGSEKKVLSVPGMDRPDVYDATDYLTGNCDTGDTVVIIGGGLTGCEIAYELSQKEKNVYIVETKNTILDTPGLCKVNSDMLKNLLNYNKVKIFTSASINSLDDTGIHFNCQNQSKEIKADSFITAIGYQPYCPAITYSECDTYYIGDCDNPDNLLHAIWQAQETVLHCG